MPRRRKLISWLLALSAPLAPALGAGQSGAGRPLIRPFGTSEVHSQGPVLSFAETGDGSVLVGSNRLVIFDGLRWQLIEVPGAYAFRALAAAPVTPGDAATKPRVWVGAIGAIGYVERDGLGTWNFVSLSAELTAAGLGAPGEIWSVSSVGKGAVFVSAQNVLRWDGLHFEQWPLPTETRLKSCADEGGTVWIGQDDVGLLKLEASGPPTLARAAESMPPGPWSWILRPAGGREAAPAGLLVGTDERVYRLTPRRWELLPAVTALVSGQSPTQAVSVAADEFAIGTQKNGVVLATLQGDAVATVDRANGLRSDTVYGLWGDRRGGVWVGLGDGCDRFDSVGIASIFDSREGLEKGLPRKVLTHGDLTYVLTDKALYRLAAGAGSATARLVPVIASAPQLNDAVASPGGIWVGGIDGLWRVGGSGTDPELFPTGNAVRLMNAPDTPGELIYTGYYSLKGFTRTAGAWSPHDLQANFNDTPVSLLADSRGDLWLSTVGDGIYRFRTSAVTAQIPHPLIQIAHYREGHGLPAAARRPVLSVIGQRLFAFTENQVLAFDATGHFEPVAGLSDWIVLAATKARPASVSPEAKEDTAYWLAQSARLADSPPLDLLRVRIAGDAIHWEPLRVTGLDNLGEITSLDLTEGSGGTFGWVGGKGGLLRVDLDRVGAAGPTRELQLREVRTDHDGLLELRPNRPVAIGPGPRRIEFSFSAAQPIESAPLAVYYQTRLQGVESDWSPPERKNTREFTGLAPGDYVFMARRVDRHGRAGETVSYPFRVIAPWYRRWPALLAYGLALALAGAGILRWRLRRLRRQTERLDRLVARRTRELELSNTAKSEFLENISHEIRNPLNGIVGLVNLLKPDRLGGEDREVARSLQASAEHLRRVSEEVLGFSKLEFGYVTVEEKPFSLGSALREVADLHREPARRQGGTVTLSLPPAGDRFVGDEAKIKTIVGNFVSNALKYAPGSPIAIRADWANDSEDVVPVFIAVADRGPGVPADEQELIFQKFVRGSNTKGGGAIGSGIGLAICRALAQRLGGAVGVESPAAPAAPGEPAAGSSFHLWLPLRRALPAPDLPPASGSGPPAAGKSLALIVDDEHYNRLVLAGLAKELGYQPLTAADAAAAVDHARRQPVDVVFLDLELPGTKGDEIARVLRRLPGGDQPVLIATTGQDSEASRQRCRDAGMDGFLLKPFSAGQVRELVARVRRQRTSVAAEAPPSRWRAFQLYAQGADGSAADAARRYLLALDQELAAIRSAHGADDRAALRSAGHRLRTLAALVQAAGLNAGAARLQDLAATLSASDLAALVAELFREAASLKAELRDLPA